MSDDYSLYRTNLETVALVHLVELALDLLATINTYTKVPQLVLRAGLNVVPGGGVVLRVSPSHSNTYFLVPDHIRRAGATQDLPASYTQGQTGEDDNGVHFHRHTNLLEIVVNVHFLPVASPLCSLRNDHDERGVTRADLPAAHIGTRVCHVVGRSAQRSSTLSKNQAMS